MYTVKLQKMMDDFGIVAEGVVFSDGSVVLEWLETKATIEILERGITQLREIAKSQVLSVITDVDARTFFNEYGSQ